MMNIMLAVVGLFVALMIGLQIFAHMKARAMQGQPIPTIPGPIGQKLARASSALVYFMSPACGACRTWTPSVEKLRKTNPNVFVVDVSQHIEVARALNVMATPSAIEIQDGRVAGYHIGTIPKAVLERFA